MNKNIIYKNTIINYELTYKKVKNINLRIKFDGTVHVSASKRVPLNLIENFVLSKAEFILKALENCKNRSQQPQKKYFSENEICEVILELCKKVYPYFEKRGVKYPQIKFRKMVSRWGSCHSVKGILTFNTNLMYAPIECIEYVALHEFTHFLQANHSAKFYDELAKVCPQWRTYRKKLKEIVLKNG